MNTNKNVCFLAISKGSESKEATEIKRYIGIGACKVVGFNPTKAQIKELMGYEPNEEPVYVGTQDIDGKQVKFARISIVVRTIPEKCNGIEITPRVTFFISNEVRYNRDKTKVQVINKYGETTWLPVEDAKAGKVPESLSWFEPADFRPAYVGEEELTAFIKAYLNIPNKSFRDANGNVRERADKSEAEARLDCIKDYFKGDFTELKTILSLQPKNKVKVLFGVRTATDGKQYQTAFTHMFLKNNVSNYSRLEEELNSRKSNGAYPTTEFEVCELKEFTVEPSTFAETTPESAPAVDMPSWFRND